MDDKSVERKRREEYLKLMPVHKQLEAFRDYLDGKPAKYNAQTAEIEKIKQKHKK